MLLIGQVASTLILSVAIIVVTGILPPETYAEYTITMVPVGIATLLMDPGINSALIKYIAQYQYQGRENERRDAQITGTIINTAIATALTLIVYVAAEPIMNYYLRPELTPLLRTASFAILAQALLNLSYAIFIGHHRMGLQSLTSMTYAVVKGIAMPGLVLLGLRSNGAVIGNLVGFIVAGIVGVLLTLTFLKGGEAKFSGESANTMLRYGLPIYLSNIVGGALTQIQSSLTIIYLENTIIGNWGAAQNFAVLVNFLTVPISTTLFPLFSKLEKGSSNLKHAYRNAIKYSALIALPGATALIALAYPMMGIIYGARYPLSPDYFRLLLLTYAPVGLGSVCTIALLNGQGETRVTLRIYITNLIIGAAMSMALVPPYGIPGLIIAMILSPLPAFIYSLWWISRHLGLEPDWSSSAKIYAASLSGLLTTSGVTILAAGNNWLQFILGAATYLATYLAALKLTNTLTDEDYKMFRVIIGDTGPLAKYLHSLFDLYQRL